MIKDIAAIIVVQSGRFTMMKSPSQYAYAKTVTEDSNSNDASFSYDDDDGIDSDEIDKVFQDHNFSLSQVAVNDNVDGEEFEEEDEDDDQSPSYDDPAIDNELANNWETLQKTASPKKKKIKRQRSIKTYGVQESIGRRRLSYGTRIGVKEDDGSVYLKGQRGDRLFKPGETFLSSKKEYDGMAFTLGNMDCFDGDMIWKAECTAVWMRVEKTFISDAAAGIVEQKWVLLKKHKDLPQWQVIIPLAELSTRLPWKPEDDNAPNNMKSPHLCYKMEDDKTCSYYYERGKEVKWAPKKTSEGGPLATDLFAGGGGASLGLQNAGWNVHYKLEWNEEASTTLDINFKVCKIFQDSIENFLKKMKTCHEKNMNMHPAPLEAIYIHGSPPCQGWSLVNTSGGVNDTQNNKCTMTFLNAVLHFQPKFVSMENVPGLLTKGLDVLRKVMAVLAAKDYQVQLCELEATDYGDAQKRKRIILLASKKGWQLPSIPAATHGPGLLPKRTAKDAIGDLEKIEPTETGRVLLDGGKEIHDHYKKSTELCRKVDKATVLDANEAAGTVRKQNPIIHYLKHRYITARERSR